MISIGHAITRGLGRLKGTLEKLDVMYIASPKRPLDANLVHGVGALLADAAERKSYGYEKDDRFRLTNPPPAGHEGVRQVQSFADAALRRSFFNDAVGRWSDRMDQWGKGK